MMFSSLRSEEVEEEVQPLGAPEEELANSPDGSQHCLWVDEFAPQYYTELLSDDVRPCRSNVTGFFVSKDEQCGIQLILVSSAHRPWGGGRWF